MISLSMAQPLEASIRNRQAELRQELDNSLKVSYVKGETPLMPPRKVEDILKDMEKVERDLRRLRVARDLANHQAVVAWKIEGYDKLSIAEALELAKQFRERLNLYRQMARENPNVHSVVNFRSFGSGSDMLARVTYDPAFYQHQAKKLERQVNALSIAIDKANQTVQLEFDASPYLEGLES